MRGIHIALERVSKRDRERMRFSENYRKRNERGRMCVCERGMMGEIERERDNRVGPQN